MHNWRLTMTYRFSIALAFILSLGGFTNAAPPKVVMTSPDNGEIDVAPDLKELRIEFDQAMNPRGRSIVGGGESFPEISGELKWLNDKTLIIPVTLKPEQQYQLSINNDTFGGFTSKSGQPAEWYPVQFRTRAAGAPAAEPDVTPEQNKQALAALKRAIDQDYSYRDRKKVDWEKEIAKRATKFETARSANEFARVTAHLLRLAEDAHVSVEAGDVRIGTRANSASPNFNFQALSNAVPSWKKHASGIFTGRFEDGLGYILFSECTKEQADGFDAALDELKDTKGLILDARFNSGGGEDAAQQVAGRFVEKPAVYSKNRIREGGNWKGPFDRLVEPRGERYAKPVVVLIGPKVGSSAESFVLMMKHGANAKLIGVATKGSSGRPMAHQLGNGVTVYLSSWEDQLPDGTLLEGRGVRPDVIIKTTPQDLAQSDAVLEAGLKSLRGNHAREKADAD
jgi:carboxyl-terminal processing protease